VGCLDVELEYRGLNDILALSLTHIEASGDRNIGMRLTNSLQAECFNVMCSFRMFDPLDAAVMEIALWSAAKASDSSWVPIITLRYGNREACVAYWSITDIRFACQLAVDSSGVAKVS
jgi:hypothetical protein